MNFINKCIIYKLYYYDIMRILHLILLAHMCVCVCVYIYICIPYCYNYYRPYYDNTYNLIY